MRKKTYLLINSFYYESGSDGNDNQSEREGNSEPENFENDKLEIFNYYSGGESDNEDFQTAKEEVRTFFRFHVFPNLKKLNLYIQEDCLVPLDTFVIKGLSFLTKLEKFSLHLYKRPVGTKFLLEGMLALPMLLHFNLDIPFFSKEEYSLIFEFFGKQNKLQHLGLHISKPRSKSAGYSRQNEFLENIWQCLKEKPNLQTLHIRSSYFPVQSLAQGLKKAPILDKLEEFSITVFDDFLISQETPSKQVKGLCEFIEKHKKSIKCIRIALCFLTQKDIMTSILNSVSELEELESLSLEITSISFNRTTNRYQKLLKQIYQVQDLPLLIKEYEPISKDYSFFEKMLRKLKKMSFCYLYINSEKAIERRRFLKWFDIFPSLKNLRTIWIIVSIDESFEKNEEDIESVISRLKNVTSLEVETLLNHIPESLQKSVVKLNENQSLKCDLMFYSIIQEDCNYIFF